MSSNDEWSSFHDDLVRPTEKRAEQAKQRALSSGPSARTAGVEWDGVSGEIRSGALESAPGTWDDLLRQWDLDPNEVEIVGPVRRSSWEVAGHGTLNSYRARIQKKNAARDFDFEQLAERISARKPTKREAPSGENSFVACYGDTQFGKALEDSTPILTSEGWKSHGELRPGDMVMSPKGVFVQVLAVTGSEKQQCYRLDFDAGESLVASGQHQWVGFRRYKDKPYTHYFKREVTLTTDELFALPRERRNGGWFTPNCLQIPLPSVLDLSEVALPIDPYLLGVWLGDGVSSSGSITMATPDMEEINFPGTSPKSRTGMTCRTVDGLYRKLRVAGLLKNKHVPPAYLTASRDQRLALLQGLMDSDGYCSPEGTCEFSATRKGLAEAVAQLVNSLGGKALLRIKKTSWTYRGCRKVGYAYRVTFVADRNRLPAFRLSRKLSNQTDVPDGQQTNFRHVRNVTQVGIRSAQCITVEGGMYLAGNAFIPTHNSGTEATIDRYLASLVNIPLRLKELRRSGRSLGPVFLPWLGDCIEHVTGSYASQPSTTELTLTEQIRVLRRLAWKAIEVMAPLTTSLKVPVVPGNHDQAVRAGGKQAAHSSDSFANDMASYLYDLVQVNPEVYGHVEIIVPERDSLVVTQNMSGTLVAMAHGHQFPGGADGITKWWMGQAHGCQPAGDATLLLCGHKHHLDMKQLGKKTYIQVPALDSGSQWYVDLRGQDSPSGIVTLTVGAESWDDFKIL